MEIMESQISNLTQLKKSTNSMGPRLGSNGVVKWRCETALSTGIVKWRCQMALKVYKVSTKAVEKYQSYANHKL